jgi:GTPase Era involved in 16S rRNA processing
VASIIDRLTNVRLEIAVFGQVSSGKSSLLNHILGRDILPVGVNPITAVPTRIVHGQQERVSVTFVTRKTEHHAITELRQFVSEQHNPANVKGVARIVVEIPAATLARGIVFVDTPGLGSLATAGAAETRAYLPQCDVGVLLINAGSTLGPEDVATIQSLYSAGIQPAVLMSKADLLKPADREQALAYIAAKLESELGVELPVYPVSVMAGHEELLDRWFREHVVPLFGERETLARDSIRRKIGVLRESVQAALRSKLEPVATGATAEEIEAADRRLRAAAGELSRVESLCFNKTDAIRNLGGIATRWAAMRLFKAWKSEQPFGVAEMVRSAMTEAAAADASEVSSVLNDAATALAEALGDTARVLGEPDDSARLELERAVREMPHMETSGVNFEMERPAAMLLGRTIATHVIEQRIEKTAGKEIEQACVSYSRVLRTWAHDTIALLASIFDARADRYRAQMERLLGHARAEPQTTANIEEDLRDLEESPAGDMEEERT